MVKIQEIGEAKTASNNKSFKPVTLEDNRKVNVFEDNTLYEDLAIGFEIQDNLLYQRGEYWNLRDPLRSSNPTAQQARSVGIAVAQKNKDHGIRLSSTFRMATDIAIAEGNPTLDRVYEIRQELWKHWDDPNSYVPF